jgi:hypothetical protein
VIEQYLDFRHGLRFTTSGFYRLWTLEDAIVICAVENARDTRSGVLLVESDRKHHPTGVLLVSP